MERTAVSTELLTAEAKRPLGRKIEAIVERWVTSEDPVSFYKVKDLKDLSKIVEDETGMLVDFSIQPTLQVNAFARTIAIPGHQSSAYLLTKLGSTANVTGKSTPSDLLKVKIDLEKGKVSNSIFTGLRSQVIIFTGLVKRPTVKLTAEEITAIIIHELGHVFNQYMTLGEYVWLSYLLQDGVEVVLGKKPNKYNLEVLSADGLEKWAKDKDLVKAVKEEPSEANIRRAILSAHANAPRHHITSGESLLSLAREEQAADFFASRMGYARASVTAHVKMERVYRANYRRSNTAHMAAEAIKVVSGLGALFSAGTAVVLPVFWIPAIAFIAMNRVVDFRADSPLYDKPLDRLLKFRLDLIAQLKQLKDDKETQRTILEDIKVIDGLIKDFKQHTTAWEMLTAFMLPTARRQRHQRAREQRFERLMHNDLFIAAQQLNQHTRNS